MPLFAKRGLSKSLSVSLLQYNLPGDLLKSYTLLLTIENKSVKIILPLRTQLGILVQLQEACYANNGLCCVFHGGHSSVG
jgi:hypothetical protein